MVFLILFFHWRGVGIVQAKEESESEGFNLLTDILTIFPKDKIEKAKASGYDVKYSKYNPSRYHLELSLENRQFWEVENQISDASHYLMNHVNNFIWELLLNWNFTVIMIVENAFSLDLVDQFSDAVEQAVQQLAGFKKSGFDHTGLIGNFITFMIIIAGAYLAYRGMIQKKTTDALNGMVASLIIFVLGLAFFANAGSVMRYLNQISSGLSEEVMNVGIVLQQKLGKDHEPSYPSEIASLVVADKLYRMFVYEPYLMLQYGKTSNDPELTTERIRKILDYKVGSTKRNQAVIDEKIGSGGKEPNAMVSINGTFERLTLLMLLGVSHLLLGILFLLIAGAMLVYQLMFVLSALFSPFAFLLALNPAWSNIAVNWFKNFVGYQIIKLIIGLCFSMLLTLSQFLYQMNPPEKFGYVWTITIQLILVAGVVWKRHELFSMLQTTMGKEKKAEVNIHLPLNYVAKYTNQLTNRIQKLNARNK
jgi:hypothetical protein